MKTTLRQKNLFIKKKILVEFIESNYIWLNHPNFFSNQPNFTDQKIFLRQGIIVILLDWPKILLDQPSTLLFFVLNNNKILSLK